MKTSMKSPNLCCQLVLQILTKDLQHIRRNEANDTAPPDLYATEVDTIVQPICPSSNLFKDLRIVLRETFRYWLFGFDHFAGWISSRVKAGLIVEVRIL